jgi:hypothetical protein
VKKITLTPTATPRNRARPTSKEARTVGADEVCMRVRASCNTGPRHLVQVEGAWPARRASFEWLAAWLLGQPKGQRDGRLLGYYVLLLVTAGPTRPGASRATSPSDLPPARAEPNLSACPAGCRPYRSMYCTCMHVLSCSHDAKYATLSPCHARLRSIYVSTQRPTCAQPGRRCAPRARARPCRRTRTLARSSGRRRPANHKPKSVCATFRRGTR